MKNLLPSLQQDYPNFTFTPGDSTFWSPKTKSIHYNNKTDNNSLLHELGHALLEHNTYTSDAQLVQMEAAAWDKAAQIAHKYGFVLDQERVQDSLDSYRDWLHRRSTCPNCSGHGFEPHTGRYTCPNCKAIWNVSRSRFCRTYRRLRASI